MLRRVRSYSLSWCSQLMIDRIRNHELVDCIVCACFRLPMLMCLHTDINGVFASRCRPRDGERHFFLHIVHYKFQFSLTLNDQPFISIHLCF